MARGFCPRRCPLALARASPARTRSAILARSNSAITARMCICSLPAGVVASIPSCNETKATPRACSSSISVIRCFKLRPSRSSRSLGEALLGGVRRDFPGGTLHYYSGSNRFIEFPDNFWTIKVQPRDRSLSVTVRERPEFWGEIPGLDLKRDRGSYSRFKVSHAGQLESALSVIRRAAETKRRRRR